MILISSEKAYAISY